MTEKRFTITTNEDNWIVICDNEEELSQLKVCDLLNELNDENEQLKKSLRIYSDSLRAEIRETKEVMEDWSECIDEKKQLKEENEQLKQQLYDCKKDEKQLSISFMEFKMQLIEVLQQNYNYAYNQRQRNLDNSVIVRTYELLYQTIYNIAETMNVDIERFPKGDDGNE